jgi:hypothetical protein
MRTTMLVGAVIAGAGALVALVVRPRPTDPSAATAVEADSPYVTE